MGLFDRLKRALTAYSGGVGQAAEETADEVREAAEEVFDRAGELAEEAFSKARTLADQANKTVEPGESEQATSSEDPERREDRGRDS